MPVFVGALLTRSLPIQYHARGLVPIEVAGPHAVLVPVAGHEDIIDRGAGGSIRNWSGVAAGPYTTPPSFIVNSLRSTGVMTSMTATFAGSVISGMTRAARVISSRAFPDSMGGSSLFIYFFKKLHYQDKRLGIV